MSNGTNRKWLKEFTEGNWEEGLRYHEGQHQWLSDVPMRRVDWLWQDFIPRGMVSVLTGEEGLGKSQLALKIAAEFSKGTFGDTHPANVNLDGSPQRGGQVKFYTAEDPVRYTLKPRFIANGGNLNNVATEGIESKFTLTEEGMTEMARGIDEVGFGLIVIDPIIAYFGKNSDANKAQDVREVMRHLSALAEDTGCIFIGIAHPKKGEEASALHKMIGGSSAFGQAARSVLGVARHPDEEDQRIVGRLKGNLSKPPTPMAYSISHVTLEGAAEDGRDVETSKVNLVGKWGDQDAFMRAILGIKTHSEEDDGPGELSKVEQAKSEARQLLGFTGSMTRQDLVNRLKASGFSDGTAKRAFDSMRDEQELHIGPRSDKGLQTFTLSIVDG